jgi:hypothetical protein
MSVGSRSASAPAAAPGSTAIGPRSAAAANLVTLLVDIDKESDQIALTPVRARNEPVRQT